MKVSIIYITDGHVSEGIRGYCLSRLKRQAMKGKHQLIEIRQAPEAPRCHASIYKNIITGLDAAVNKHVAIAEHDCIYSDKYFDDLPASYPISYLQEVVYLTEKGFARRDLPYAPMSTLVGKKKDVRKAVEAKIQEEKPAIAEPGIETAHFRKGGWVVDIRHGGNFTGGRDEFVEEYLNEYEGMKADEMWKSFAPVKQVAVKSQTGKGVTVIIPARVEKYLGWTIDNVKRTAPGAEIIVIHDGWTDGILKRDDIIRHVPWVTPQGVGQSREFGIMAASNDACVLLDAHMDFIPGWIEAMQDELSKNKKAIICTKSAVLREDRMNINNPEKIQGGAAIMFDSTVPFDPDWQPHKPGEVQCILGGAYMLSRDWYINGLKRPWHNAYGWGSSEQVISLVNWFLGGQNILADCLSGHLYRRAQEVIETRFTPMTRAGMWYNRMRFIDLLPVELEKKKGFVQKVESHLEFKKHRTFIYDLLKGRPAANDNEIKNEMEKQGRTMEEYVARWYPSGVEWPQVKGNVEHQAQRKPQQANRRGGIMSNRPERRFV